jgi:5-methylcytosine-specific restriction endonuclease McrA
LLAIADNAKDSGVAWPGIDYLASKTRVSRRTVIRLIKTIEDSGELIVSRELKHNRYYINVWSSTGPEVRCNRCGIPEAPEYGIEMNRHHIIPKSEGGSDDDSNIEVLCVDCHRDHHDYTSSDKLSPNDKSKNNGDIPEVLRDIYGTTGDNGGATSDTATTPEPLLTTKEPSIEDIEKIGGAGFYIFNLVGYNYDDVDAGTRALMNQYIYKYGETRLCRIAAHIFEDYPEITLRGLLGKLEHYADLYRSKYDKEKELEF